MTMIESVKIGGIVYPVRLIEGLRDGDQKLNGWFIDSACEIRVESALQAQLKRVCVIHEALHAMATQMANQDIAEAHIATLAYGIYGLLRDNPALVAWLMEETDTDARPD